MPTITKNFVPKSYLSISEGKCRIIYNGSPLCADTTISGALECAERLQVDLYREFWNGEHCAWQPMDSL